MERIRTHSSQKVIWNLSESLHAPLLKKKKKDVCLIVEKGANWREECLKQASRRNGSKLCRPDEDK